jgi:hypothetical protein
MFELGQSRAAMKLWSVPDYFRELFFFTFDLISKKLNRSGQNSFVWMISGELLTWVPKF